MSPAYARERERLVAAVAKAVAEHGYAALTVEQIVNYAGVDEEAFAAHFQTKEQGLVAAQDAFLERLWLDAASACDRDEGWPVKVRAGLEAVLSSIVEANALARVFAVEASAISLVLVERQLAALDQFARLLRRGRRAYPAAESLPEATERVLVGGVVSLVSAHLLMEEPRVIPPLEGELTELLLCPYLGRDEARRAARRAGH